MAQRNTEKLVPDELFWVTVPVRDNYADAFEFGEWLKSLPSDEKPRGSHMTDAMHIEVGFLTAIAATNFKLRFG